MKVFEFNDYRKFVRSKIEALPRRGRGEFRKIAHYLRVHTTLISQIIRGGKAPTLEQAYGFSRYFGLTTLETEYFLCLIQIEKAGTQDLKLFLTNQLKELNAKGMSLANRLPQDKIMSEPDRAIFYSNWFYSAIRMASSIEHLQTREAIAVYFNLPLLLVNQIIEFLITKELCIEDGEKIKIGPLRTHIEPDSPLAVRHHTNWRLKAIERYPNLQLDELCFTGPLTIATSDIPKVRKLVEQLIESVSEIVKESNANELACLNIDWIRVKR